MKRRLHLHTSLLLVGIGLISAQNAGAQAPATPTVTNKWEISVALGLTVAKGNSDNVMFNANGQALRKWEQNEFRTGVDGGYGESKPLGANESQKNTDYVHGFMQYNRLFNQRLYGYGRVDGLHDEIAAITYRVPLSVGLGYYVVKTPNTSLSGEVGPGYVFEKKGGLIHNYATLRFGERFEQKLSSHARLWQSLEYVPEVEDFNNYTANAELGVEADLTKKLKLRSFLQDSYVSQPAAGRKNNDIKLVAGVAYTF